MSAAVIMALPSGATADPDHGDDENQISYQEDFPGEGVEQRGQHGGTDGHLPPVQENVDVVGQVQVDDRGAGLTGRVADVAAYGDYAYLNAYFEPNCEQGGVHVIDISDPAAPVELVDAFIPTSEGSYAGEGIKIVPIAGMDVLIHNNETCFFDPAVPSGGVSLWDVTNPADPQPLALHQGDTDLLDIAYLEGSANDVHSFDVWTNQFTGRTYASLTDNFENEDVDFLDITDPANPVFVNELNLDAETAQELPEGLTSIFSHDMDVQRFGSRYVMSLNYWDGGYVLLDVTDPASVVLMDETDYALLDEEQLARGREISPEGNAHQSEINTTGDFMIGTDEDFDPFRVEATIVDGPNAGNEFVAIQGSDTEPLTEDDSFSTQPTFVGDACAPLPAGTGVALVERGTCAFQVKLDNVAAAGYSAGIVFNNIRPVEEGPDACLGLVTMLAEGDIPFMFVNREVGLQILGLEVEGEEACTTATPPAGSPTATIDLTVTFDGWGYVRLFSTSFAFAGSGPAQVDQVDTYAIPESQDPAFAIGFGDLSVHEVAMDTRPGSNLAYLSYYSGGVRVVEYGNDGITEVGAFIDEGGSNIWGVEIHEVDGEQYVLASDRDYGLYILQYTGQAEVNECDGLEATIVGTEGAETLTGTSGDDVIVGLGGNDTIVGGGGNDTICGGAGNDTIDGRAGDDRLFGGDGADTLIGAAGDDVLDGGNGADDISGDAGDDTLLGGNGEDKLRGGAGDDFSDGGADNDDITDGDGNDALAGGSGDDTLRGGAGIDFLDGGDGDDRLLGEAGDDALDGGDGDNRLNGGDGADTCGGGADTVPATSCEGPLP